MERGEGSRSTKGSSPDILLWLNIQFIVYNNDDVKFFNIIDQYKMLNYFQNPSSWNYGSLAPLLVREHDLHDRQYGSRCDTGRLIRWRCLQIWACYPLLLITATCTSLHTSHSSSCLMAQLTTCDIVHCPRLSLFMFQCLKFEGS